MATPPVEKIESIDSLLNIAMNSLAFRTLNYCEFDPPETMPEAISELAEVLRKSALALCACVNQLSFAIEHK